MYHYLCFAFRQFIIAGCTLLSLNIGILLCNAHVFIWLLKPSPQSWLHQAHRWLLVKSYCKNYNWPCMSWLHCLIHTASVYRWADSSSPLPPVSSESHQYHFQAPMCPQNNQTLCIQCGALLIGFDEGFLQQRVRVMSFYRTRFSRSDLYLLIASAPHPWFTISCKSSSYCSST